MNRQSLLHLGVEMKKNIIAIPFLLSFLSVSSVLGLGLTAGTVRIIVDVGSSNSSRFGLLNSGNETVIVKLRAEGEAAQFLEFPTTLELIPKKLTYVAVTATIPADYDGAFGGNITGNIFAVQEGTPGQVQINVQARKAVQILIPEFGGKLPEPTQIQQTSEQKVEEESSLTGFTSLLSSNPLLSVGLGAAIVLVIAFIISRTFNISIKRR